MMHHTKFLKRCFAQPRLLLQTFLLGMLLTGCLAIMAGFGASMASARSSNEQQSTSHHKHHPKHKVAPTEEATPVATVTPVVEPVNRNNIAGTDTTAAGSKNAGGVVPVGGIPVGGIPVGGGAGGGVPGGGAGGGVPGGGGAGRPGLPYTGSDPGNNPLP